MKCIQHSMILLAAGLFFSSTVQADICQDMRAIHVASQQKFNAWKIDHNALTESFGSTFMMAGANSCFIDEDGISYTCQWRFETPEALSQAYRAMRDEMAACPPLLAVQPEIKQADPTDMQAGRLRQKMTNVAYDYGIEDIVIFISTTEYNFSITGLPPNTLHWSLLNAKPATD
jgi:hypothetical protein